jgi:uncharacterized protein YukE
MTELRVKPSEVHQSGVEIGEIAATLKSAFTNSDTEIASAQSGWVGESAGALASMTTEWQEATKKHSENLVEHGSGECRCGGQFAIAGPVGVQPLEGCRRGRRAGAHPGARRWFGAARSGCVDGRHGCQYCGQRGSAGQESAQWVEANPRAVRHDCRSQWQSRGAAGELFVAVSGQPQPGARHGRHWAAEPGQNPAGSRSG